MTGYFITDTGAEYYYTNSVSIVIDETNRSNPYARIQSRRDVGLEEFHQKLIKDKKIEVIPKYCFLKARKRANEIIDNLINN